MKPLATLLLLFTGNLSMAQAVFKVDNFSKDYYGKIMIEDTSEVFSKGWVAIFDRKTNKEILRVISDELALSLHDGQAIANIKELPYGEQSSILYEDYNFEHNGKQVVLFNINDRTLNYALVQKNGQVEFAFPGDLIDDPSNFRMDTTKNNYSVVFNNNNATYKIYEAAGKVGIDIRANGKTYNWVGVPKTQQGRLNKLLEEKLDNVVYE